MTKDTSDINDNVHIKTIGIIEKSPIGTRLDIHHKGHSKKAPQFQLSTLNARFFSDTINFTRRFSRITIDYLFLIAFIIFMTFSISLIRFPYI
jgi:hypothetical protein